MCAFDFSREDEQKEFVTGPVPAGSIVLLELEVLDCGSYAAPDDPYIRVAQSGLRQMYCQFTVCAGSYEGVRFRQNITLPIANQTISLSPTQQTACKIGGAQLKALCLSAKKPMRFNNLSQLTGWHIVALLKINQRPTQKDNGKTYWNNEIDKILTPQMDKYREHYNMVSRGEEIIDVHGAITGTQKPSSQYNQPDYDVPASAYDEPPF